MPKGTNSTPIMRISRDYSVSIASIMGNPHRGKAYEAQCRYVAYLDDVGLTKANIAAAFGATSDWVTRRLIDSKTGAG